VLSTRFQSKSYCILIATGQLYALFKMVTVSRTPQGGKPSIFDVTGRAKWEAWSKESKESELAKESLEDVQNRYLALCGKHGWVPNTTQEANTENVMKKNTDEEDVHDIDWDAPDDPHSDEHRHKGASMGNAVSVLEREEEDALDLTTLHGLTVLGETEKLRTLLDLDHAVDINEKDEYVSTQTRQSIAAVYELMQTHSGVHCATSGLRQRTHVDGETITISWS
jgi:acyl-CoA-binding protein